MRLISCSGLKQSDESLRLMYLLIRVVLACASNMHSIGWKKEDEFLAIRVVTSSLLCSTKKCSWCVLLLVVTVTATFHLHSSKQNIFLACISISMVLFFVLLITR